MNKLRSARVLHGCVSWFCSPFSGSICRLCIIYHGLDNDNNNDDDDDNNARALLQLRVYVLSCAYVGVRVCVVCMCLCVYIYMSVTLVWKPVKRVLQNTLQKYSTLCFCLVSLTFASISSVSLLFQHIHTCNRYVYPSRFFFFSRNTRLFYWRLSRRRVVFVLLSCVSFDVLTRWRGSTVSSLPVHSPSLSHTLSL